MPKETATTGLVEALTTQSEMTRHYQAIRYLLWARLQVVQNGQFFLGPFFRCI